MRRYTFFLFLDHRRKEKCFEIEGGQFIASNFVGTHREWLDLGAQRPSLKHLDNDS